MTQPVQEGSQARIDNGQNWRTSQLYRRPSSVHIPGGGPTSVVFSDFGGGVTQDIPTDTEGVQLDFGPNSLDGLNALGLTTVDNITFDLTGTGAFPLYAYTVKVRTDDPDLVESNWRVGISSGLIVPGGSRAVVGADPTNGGVNPVIFDVTGFFTWSGEDDGPQSLNAVTVYQDSGVTITVESYGLWLTYIGQSGET